MGASNDFQQQINAAAAQGGVPRPALNPFPQQTPLLMQQQQLAQQGMLQPAVMQQPAPQQQLPIWELMRRHADKQRSGSK